MADTVHILARYHREADIMADTVHILARYHPEADTRSAETVQNSAAAHRQHTPTGVTATGVPVTGVAETGAAVIGVGIGRVAGSWGGGPAFLPSSGGCSPPPA